MMRPTLRTDRLALRQIEPTDAEPIAALIGDWDVARMLARVPHPYMAADAEQFIARRLATPISPDDIFYAIVLDGAFVGGVGNGRNRSGDANIGYWLGKPYWGRGLMTEAVCAVTSEYFAAAPDAEGLASGVFADNPASMAVQRKLGFEVVGEGLLRCIARGADVPHYDMWLPRARWGPLPPASSSARFCPTPWQRLLFALRWRLPGLFCWSLL